MCDDVSPSRAALPFVSTWCGHLKRSAVHFTVEEFAAQAAGAASLGAIAVGSMSHCMKRHQLSHSLKRSETSRTQQIVDSKQAEVLDFPL